ncbi:MAG TPA: sulfite exporter TauE/SafE family protein [Dehalococcoidia bacterium]|nr:sulfite exporter TauE/SafE family protein [Dehalococcoidia bacterium]
MDVLEVVGLAVAAFVAGAINAVAGGGSLVSFPALLAAGYAAKPANVTNTVAIWPGTLGGSYAYRSELGRQRRRIVMLLAPAIAGGIAGSALLLTTSSDTFDAIVPFLIMIGVLLILFQDWIGKYTTGHHFVSQGEGHIPVSLIAVVFAGAVYGGYFGAGLGIILLASLSIMLPDDLQHSNALKGILASVINGVAVLYFIAFGPVRWGPAVLMAGAALAGGYLGVGLARRLGPAWLRRVVVVYGTIAAIVLLVK